MFCITFLNNTKHLFFLNEKRRNAILLISRNVPEKFCKKKRKRFLNDLKKCYSKITQNKQKNKIKLKNKCYLNYKSNK